MKLIYKSINDAVRGSSSWEDRWATLDRSLVTAWEAGREIGNKDKEVRSKAQNGELPVLPCKGGIERKIQKKEKYGSLLYLAQWQGVRGDDLNIDLAKDYAFRCTKTGMLVKFTLDSKLLFNEQ